MKRLFLLLSITSLTFLNVKAQTIVGDMNNDGEVDVADVTAVVNTAIGKTAKRNIDVYQVDNTSIVGTWTSATEGYGSVTFNEDGTTDYETGYTYEYQPNLGRLIFYDSSGIAVKMLSVIKTTPQYIILTIGPSALSYYYKGSLVKNITLSETSITDAAIGQTYQLTATISPEDAISPSITWSSSDENVATVDANGLVTMKSVGIVTITATATDKSGKTASCTIVSPSVTLDKGVITLDVDATATLTATVPLINVEDASVIWSSSNTNVATVSNEGKVTAVDYGNTTVTATVYLKNGSSATATCLIIVSKPHEYVDLGLPSGTLWATCNVGAETSEDYGDYFAWGETTGYNSGKTSFSWSNYKWCDSSSNRKLTKYCTNKSYGTVDNKIELDPEDDAAYMNWGEDWRMPSYDQIKELCDSNYTTVSLSLIGTDFLVGARITSKTNGNSIFLPAAGYYSDSNLSNRLLIAYYWSRTNSSTYYANCFWVCTYDYYQNEMSRCDGVPVRPVRSSTIE